MKSFIDNGDLVPDTLIINIFMDNFSRYFNNTGFITDGYPRTINQAKDLDNIFNKHNINSKIILIDVPENILINRLLSRKRFDDTQNVIENRIKTYNREVEDILKYYGKRILKVNGNQDVDMIYSQLKVLINNA